MTDPAIARVHPALALLSALAHPQDAEVLEAVLPRVLESELETDKVRYYFDVIMERGGDLVMALLERIMDHRPEFRSKWAIERMEEGRREGRQEGHREGRQEGHREGRQEGHREGRQEGRREHASHVLRTIVARRGLVLDAVREMQIDQCDDVELLDRWIDRAVTASSVDEIFQQDS